MTTKLSATQRDVLGHMAADGGILERRPGGFWTTPSTPDVRPGVPAWWVATGTATALWRKGLIRETHTAGGRRAYVTVYTLTEPEWDEYLHARDEPVA
jgi:hypothetical protein